MEILEKLGINGPWLLSQTVNFVLLLVILRAFAYRPIFNMLETRKTKIQESLEYAERVKQEAAAERERYEKELAEARRQAQEALAQASRVGEQARAEMVAQAREEARHIIDEAHKQADQERRQALSQARDRVAELAILAARRVIGDSLDEVRQRRLIAEFLEKVDTLEQ